MEFCDIYKFYTFTTVDTYFCPRTVVKLR